MSDHFVFIGLIYLFIFLLGTSVGRSIMLLKFRKEENKKRELELKVFEKRSEVLKQGKEIAYNLEELLYKARVQQEIDQIIRKKESH
jgi:hypothetical protein